MEYDNNYEVETMEQLIEPNIILDDDEKQGTQGFQCPLCGKNYYTKLKIEDHFLLEHEGAKLYHCSLCDSSYSYEKNLKAHMKKRHPSTDDSNTLKSGPKIGLYSNKLNQSDETMTKLPLSLKCPVCELTLTSQRKLEEHYISDHEGMKPYHCSICDARFSYETSIIRHISAVHEGRRPHLCDQCPKSFCSKHDLKRHTDTVHTKKEKPTKSFQCTVCGATFSYQNCLQRHLRKNHNMEMEKPQLKRHQQ